jgi:hypothetical protein
MPPGATKGGVQDSLKRYQAESGHNQTKGLCVWGARELCGCHCVGVRCIQLDGSSHPAPLTLQLVAGVSSGWKAYLISSFSFPLSHHSPW